MFRRYLRPVGVCYALIIVGTFTAYAGLTSGGHIFLSSWTDDPDLANFSQWPAESIERRQANDYYIGIYGLFGILQSKCLEHAESNVMSLKMKEIFIPVCINTFDVSLFFFHFGATRKIFLKEKNVHYRYLHGTLHQICQRLLKSVLE